MSDGHWRWNVGSVWENYSSLCQELHLAQHAKNNFFKYHHTKTALFFAVGAVESFLNKTMRKHMTDNGSEEEEIYDRMKAGLGKKLDKWPQELCSKDILLTNELREILNDYKDMRNEVTHPKARDHSIYKRIDEMDAGSLKGIVAEYIISILEAREEPYEYFLFGWNFIDPKGEPCYSNNHQFLWSLSWMGFRIPAGDADRMDAWIKQNMSSIGGYRAGLKVLNYLSCEPRYKDYPGKPRLCKQWWDEQHVKECGCLKE